MRDRVVITGLSAISSAGVGLERFVDAVVSGACGLRPIEAFDTTDCHSHLAACIRDFDPTTFFPPLKLRRIDAAGRLALAGTRLLLEDARWESSAAGHEGIGVALGTSTAGLDSTVDYLRGLLAHGPTGVPALMFSSTVANAAASLCAIEFGLRGPNVTFSHREASSVLALAYALGALRDGRGDAMVSGGVDRLVEILVKMHDRFRALSPCRRSRWPEGARPFDLHRNGWVFGEGGFLVLLETAVSARRRGARAYGELLGAGVTAATTAVNDWPAESSAIVRAMRQALADGELSPDDVDVVFATANGSPWLDRLEAAALAEVFEGRPVPVVSLKGGFGECSASGAAAVAAALLTLRRGVVPPTVGLATPDPDCPVAVSGSARSTTGTTALINSVSAGGTQGSLVVRTVPDHA